MSCRNAGCKEDWIMGKTSILFAFLLFACTLASTQDENFD